ncbi:hypothetical protein [Agrobacterium tumefaciens]|uniref:hypothetical protein n=1 Tax=Agrobacterium tumefaciens TaxID=358 RepID=UPI003969C6FE
MRYERSLIYADEGNRLMITKRIDGEPATVANGGTIGIAAASPEHVLAWHAASILDSIQTPPAERQNGAFVAYLLDPDGNKLTVRSQLTK